MIQLSYGFPFESATSPDDRVASGVPDGLTGTVTRSLGRNILSSVLALPEPPARLVADWERDISGLAGLEPGDVDVLSLPRTRARWPGLRECAAAVSAWLAGLQLEGVLHDGAMALMACRGAPFHHDAALYGASAFCNVFLSEDKGLDVLFPAAGVRIPLERGTVLLFDTAQPHAVVGRGCPAFVAEDFSGDADYSQVFLTWELPLSVDNTGVARVLGICHQPLAPTASATGVQIWWNEKAARMCPDTGLWQCDGQV